MLSPRAPRAARCLRTDGSAARVAVTEHKQPATEGGLTASQCEKLDRYTPYCQKSGPFQALGRSKGAFSLHKEVAWFPKGKHTSVYRRTNASQSYSNSILTLVQSSADIWSICQVHVTRRPQGTRVLTVPAEGDGCTRNGGPTQCQGAVSRTWADPHGRELEAGSGYEHSLFKKLTSPK